VLIIVLVNLMNNEIKSETTKVRELGGTGGTHRILMTEEPLG
jgi:hypothetical protein